MAVKNNASFTPLFGVGPDKSGLKVTVGAGGKLTVQRVAVTEVEPDPPTPEEVEAMREQAFADGVAQGTAEALSAHQHLVEQALEQIGGLLAPMIQTMDQAIDARHRDAGHLAFAIASRLAPALIARCPRAEIEALVDQCLGTVKTEPKLVITMNPGLIEELRQPLEVQAEKRGFTGRLVLAEDENLTGADLRIEWAGGGADRDMGQVMADIEALIERYVGEIAPALSHQTH